METAQWVGLVIVAFFVIATFGGIKKLPWIHFGWLGLAVWALVALVL